MFACFLDPLASGLPNKVCLVCMGFLKGLSPEPVSGDQMWWFCGTALVC